MKSAVALVDYDNIREKYESNAKDVSINLSIMIPSLTYTIKSHFQDVEEIKFRLYGGWSQKDGQSTQQCGWLLGEMYKYNKRHGTVRAKCSLARELISRSDLQLIGTYRDKEQKMVDGMIISDLIHLSTDKDMSIVLVSDDNDFVPGIITGSVLRSKKEPILVLRPVRKTKTPLNDHLYQTCHVTLAKI